MCPDNTRPHLKIDVEKIYQDHEDINEEEGSTEVEQLEDKVVVISRNNKVCEINVDDCDSIVDENQRVTCLANDQQGNELCRVTGQEESTEKSEKLQKNVKDESESAVTCYELKGKEEIIKEKESVSPLDENPLKLEIECRGAIAMHASDDQDEDAGAKDIHKDEGVDDKNLSYTDSDCETLNLHDLLRDKSEAKHDKTVHNTNYCKDDHNGVIDLFLENSNDEDTVAIEQSQSDASMITLVFDNKTKPTLHPFSDTKPDSPNVTEIMEPVSESPTSVFSTCAGCTLS